MLLKSVSSTDAALMLEGQFPLLGEAIVEGEVDPNSRTYSQLSLRNEQYSQLGWPSSHCFKSVLVLEGRIL